MFSPWLRHSDHSDRPFKSGCRTSHCAAKDSQWQSERRESFRTEYFGTISVDRILILTPDPGWCHVWFVKNIAFLWVAAMARQLKISSQGVPEVMAAGGHCSAGLHECSAVCCRVTWGWPRGDSDDEGSFRRGMTVGDMIWKRDVWSKTWSMIESMVESVSCKKKLISLRWLNECCAMLQ